MKQKNHRSGYLSALMLLLCGLMIIFFIGCTKRPTAKFGNSDKVKAVISGDVGMIIGTWCGDNGCWYDVRFPVKQSATQTHVLSKDGPITTAPLAVVENMREYELELVQ